jgi:predicted kinase
MHERVYGEVRSATALLLAGGQSVVVDAVHGGAEERDGIEAVARDAGAQFAGLWLQAPPEVLEARLAARKADVSDATAEVMRAQLQAVLVPDDWRKIDASQSAEDTLARASLSVPVCPSFRGP